MEKILTVVVPTYNMEHYLDRCLSSLIVAPELMKLLEVIVVNDGSKDRSSEIAHGYADRYPDTFVVIDKENGNYGSCVNKGIELARGKYFRILDADDWYSKENFSDFLSFLICCNADLVYTKRVVHDGSGPKESFLPPEYSHERYMTLEEYDSILNKPYLYMHEMTYSTSVLRESGLQLQTGISYTDSEYCFYPLQNVNNVHFLDKVVYHYDMSRPGQTMSSDKLAKSIGDMFKVVYAMVVYYNEQKRKDLAMPSMQIQVLEACLKGFYQNALTNCIRSKGNNMLLRKMDDELKIRPELYLYTDNLSINRVRYVHLWRCTGIYRRGLFFSCYDSFYHWAKRRILWSAA